MPDVNVLVYAHRADDPAHGFYRDWLESVVNTRTPFALSSEVAAAFIRIVTHPKFPSGPTPLSVAWSQVDTLADRSNCRLVYPTNHGWIHFRKLTLESKAAGKLVADARHAAVAIENGYTWVTRDRDFERFTPQGLSLRILEPPPLLS